MGSISLTGMIAIYQRMIVGALIGVLGGASFAIAQDSQPDKVYGTKAGEIELFAPADVVSAGAADAASTYRFFAHEDGTAANINAATNITHGTGLNFVLVAPKEYTQGLQVGPFHTGWEGSLEVTFARNETATLAVSVKHTFADGKTLTTRRTISYRVSSDGVDIPLAGFDSITQLELGDVTADDGTTIVITPALLAAPVTISVNANLDCARNCTLRIAEWEIEAVTFWQLRDPILSTGTDAPLSETLPLVESGTGNAGVALTASRGDHVHPADGGGSTTPLSDAIPKNLGTAAAGSSSDASRGDHVHKLPNQIASNAAAIARKPDLTDNEPKAVGNAAAVGRGTEAARDDHAHKFNNYGASIKEIGNSNIAGVLEQVSRVDHVHGRGTARYVSDPGAAGVNNNDVLTRTGATSYGWAAPTGGGGGATEFTELTDTPADYMGSAGKVPTVNADEDALAFATLPPDLTEELDDAIADGENNTADIEALDFLTQDITAGIPSTEWANITDTTNAGIALFDDAASCAQARGATYAAGFASGAGNKASIVRIKTGFALANVRVEVKGRLATETYEDLLTGWSLLCTSTDGTFGYYHELYADGVVAFGPDVQSVQVQTTGGAHIGTSKYSGDPTKVERWAIIGDSTTVPIAKTLPTITGHGDKVLTVNAAATGVAWEPASASGGSGSGCTWEEIWRNGSRTTWNGTGSSVRFTTQADIKASQGITANYNATDGSKYILFSATATASQTSVALGSYQEESSSATDVEIGGGAWFDGADHIVSWAVLARSSGILIQTVTDDGSVPQIVTFVLRGLKCEGGGGGSTNPTIPDPTPAGALQHLRVNASGAAYELAVPPTGVPDCTNCEHDVLVRTDDGDINWSDRLSEIDQPSFAETAANHHGQLLTIESCGDDGEKIACTVGYTPVNETQWDKIDERTITGIGGMITYTIAAREVDDVFTLMQAGAGSAFHSFVLYGTWQTSSSGDNSFVSAARWELAGLPPGDFISPEYEEFRTWGMTRTAGSDSHVSMVVNDRGTITIQIDGLNSEGQGKGTFALYGVR